MREGFLLFVSFREISFTAYSSSEITQTYLKLSSAKLLLNSPGNAPRFMCQKSIQLYGFPNNKCCTDYLDSCAKIYAKTIWNMQQEQLLEIRASFPRKLCPKIGLYSPRNSCQICTDCTEFHPEINASSCLGFCASKCLYGSLGMCANLLKTLTVVSLDFCA
jgi:hypothetical protein